MKLRLLAQPAPLRSSPLPWDSWAVLPPENKERRRRSKDYQASPPPAERTFVLVDVLAEIAKLSKGKARRAIQRGRASVNGVVVRDPDTRLKSADVVRFFPPSKTHVSS